MIYHEELENDDFLILLFFVHLLVMLEEHVFISFLVTLKYGLYRNGSIDN